jgi:hypothetical protein
MSYLLLLVCVVALVHVLTGVSAAQQDLSMCKISEKTLIRPTSTQDTNEAFGGAIAVSGKNMVVGAPQGRANDGGFGWVTSYDSGVAYIFFDYGNHDYQEVARLRCNDLAVEFSAMCTNDDYTYYGHAVDISGNTAVVSARNVDYATTNANLEGALYVYTTPDELDPLAGWTFTQRLIAPDITGSTYAQYLGQTVHLVGNTIITGALSAAEIVSGCFCNSAGGVYTFSRANNGAAFVDDVKIVGSFSWKDQEFGHDTAVGNAGIEPYSRLVISGPTSRTSDGGRVYIFERTDEHSNDWEEVTILYPSDMADPTYEDSAFGYSLALNAEGETLVVGCDLDERLEKAYVFHYSFFDLEWSEVQLLTSSQSNGRFGSRDMLIQDGLMLFGMYDYVRIYTRIDDDEWVFLTDFETAGDNTRFGSSLAFTPNNTAVTRGILVGDHMVHSYAGNVRYFSLDCVDGCVSDSGNATCAYGGVCTDLAFGVSCACEALSDGDYCENCLCAEASQCRLVNQDWMCDCDFPTMTNTIGPLCANPCVNGMSASNYTECDCGETGTEGTYCEDDINECDPTPCLNAGACTDHGYNNFSCECAPDYNGELCQHTLCIFYPCLNGGLCEDGVDIACDCVDTGFEGDVCELPVNDCLNHTDCGPGNCTDLHLGYECVCDGTGYAGEFCDEEIFTDDCITHECSANATCVDTGAVTYTCDCDPGYEGSFCTQASDECASNPCFVGECIDSHLDFACNCSGTEYIGAICDILIQDACQSRNPCGAYGACEIDMHNYRTCACYTNTGYEGIYCNEKVFDSQCLPVNPCLHGGICHDSSNATDDMYCDCSSGQLEYNYGELCDVHVCDAVPCEDDDMTCVYNTSATLMRTCTAIPLNVTLVNTTQLEDDTIENGLQTVSLFEAEPMEQRNWDGMDFVILGIVSGFFLLMFAARALYIRSKVKLAKAHIKRADRFDVPI